MKLWKTARDARSCDLSDFFFFTTVQVHVHMTDSENFTCPRALIMGQTSNGSGTVTMLEAANEWNVPMHLMMIPKAMLGARRAVYLAALRVFNRSCPDSVAVLTDSSDAFVRCNSTDLRRRVLRSQHKVLVSGDIYFNFAPHSTLSYFNAKAAEHFARKSGTHNLQLDGTEPRYVNVGGLAGRVSHLLPFMIRANATEGPQENSSTTRSWFTPWHDQAPITHVVQRDAEELGIGIDYDTDVFYVASGRHLSLANATRHILSADPCFVHVPGTHDVRVQQHLKALWHRFWRQGTKWPRTPTEIALERREAASTAVMHASAEADERSAGLGVKGRDRVEKLARGWKPRPKA